MKGGVFKMKRCLCLFIAFLILSVSGLLSFNAFADSAEGTMPGVDKTTESVKADTSDSVSPSESAAVRTYPSAGVDSFTNYSFPILVYGMLGIFLVLGLIAISIYFLGKIPSKSDGDKK